MIVFTLGCNSGHRFDGWFGSSGDYESQRTRGLLECPICADKAITKHLSAPRLNLSGGGATSEPAEAAREVPVTAEAAERVRMLAAQTEFYKQLRSMLEKSD